MPGFAGSRSAEPDRQMTGRDDARASLGEADTDPRPPAVTFVTTEHFVLQGARAATIAESTGRATMFLASVSGGLVALGWVATASRVGTAFYAFGLVLLPRIPHRWGSGLRARGQVLHPLRLTLGAQPEPVASDHRQSRWTDPDLIRSRKRKAEAPGRHR